MITTWRKVKYCNIEKVQLGYKFVNKDDSKILIFSTPTLGGCLFSYKSSLFFFIDKHGYHCKKWNKNTTEQKQR